MSFSWIIQSINWSQVQVWLCHSSRSCHFPAVGMLVCLKTPEPAAENERKELWMCAETYRGSAHGQSKTFTKCLGDHRIVESLRLEKIFKILESNLLNPTLATRPHHKIHPRATPNPSSPQTGTKDLCGSLLQNCNSIHKFHSSLVLQVKLWLITRI